MLKGSIVTVGRKTVPHPDCIVSFMVLSLVGNLPKNQTFSMHFVSKKIVSGLNI